MQSAIVEMNERPVVSSHAMEFIDDPILSRFRAALDEVYGRRVERVVLFGSRARGDARPDSDYDVAVFLEHPEGFAKEMGKIGNRDGHFV